MDKDKNRLEELLKTDRYKFLKYFPRHIALQSIKEDFYTDFVLNFLIKKGGKGKITQLLLDINGLDLSLDWFMSSQKATENKYADVLKKKRNYYKLNITSKGISQHEYICKEYIIKVPTLIQKIKRYILNLRKNIFSLVFVSANNKINNIMESGIIKLMLFIIALLGLIIAAKSVGLL